jgi:hypothetical protein
VAVDIAASLVFAVGLGAQLRYLQRLAERLPDQRLAKQAKSISNTFPVCYALVAGWEKYAVLAPGGAVPTSMFAMVLGCTSVIAGLGALGCFATYVRVLRGMSERLATEASFSSLVWDPEVLDALVRK